MTRSTPRALEILRVFLIARVLSNDTLDFSVWQDYRNDFTFDLRMVDQTSGRQVSYERRKGTASGAERQVPYYVIIGLQIVIAAPSEKRAVVYENLDSVIDVFRYGDSDSDSAESATIKPLARSAMRAANPQHLQVEQLAMMLEESREAAE